MDTPYWKCDGCDYKTHDPKVQECPKCKKWLSLVFTPNIMAHVPGTVTIGPHAVELTRESWRYLFAGLAAQGLLSDNVNGKTSEFAVAAVKIADALLAELERTAKP